MRHCNGKLSQKLEQLKLEFVKREVILKNHIPQRIKLWQF